MTEQVMVYEVKSSAVENARGLFSGDNNYFYWNDSSFKFLNEGDYVFVVNTTDKWVLFTQFIDERIPTELDRKALISRFSHRGKIFEPAAPTIKKLNEWKNFVHLEVFKKVNFPAGWTWKSLGSSETTYLNGSRVNKNASENRILNIEQLKMLSEDQKYQAVLNASLENFVDSRLNPAILKAIESDSVQKVLSESDFYFQIALDKLSEFEAFSKLNNSDLRALLDQFLNSKQTYSKFILTQKDNSPQHELLILIGEVVSYCDLNAAGKNELNQYDDKRVLAKSNVRQTDWVKWLLRYKINGHNLEGIPDSIRNAFVYLKHPGKGSTMLSENHRELVSQNLLGVDYDSKSFVDSLKKFFDPYELTPENPQNETRVISTILYDNRVKDLWDLGFIEEKSLSSNDLSFKEVVEHAHQYIMSKGFNYYYEDVANFYLSLKTKPFIILAGISGTGKTQLPRKFAEAVGMKKEEQVIQVPVRPDWTDSSDLIGYTALDGNFVPKPLIESILKAKNDKEKRPYFFILDEMNLARVEHYFSDFLSIIETRELKGDQILTDVILRDETFKTSEDRKLYGNLTWPENLFLIGTVNMDETTHAFSRKVLDRANSIEMNSIDLSWINSSAVDKDVLNSLPSNFFLTEFIASKQIGLDDQKAIESEMEMLLSVNDILKQADLHFAYRVRDEVAFYLILNSKYELMNPDTAMDFQMMQKVLPRIHGSSRRVYKALLEILGLLINENLSDTEFEISDLKEKVGEISSFPYPKSITKVLFMLERFDEDRFTSFWI